MSDVHDLVQDLERRRDEIRLKIHLGSRDLQDQWSDLEGRFERFRAQAQLDRSARDLADAVRLLGSEIKDGYERIRSAL